jgi:hypothetical protein
MWVVIGGQAPGVFLIGMSLSTSSNCSLTSSITTCFPPDLLDLPSVAAIEAHLFPLPSTLMTKGQQTLSFLVYSLSLPISRPRHSHSPPLKHSMNLRLCALFCLAKYQGLLCFGGLWVQNFSHLVSLICFSSSTNIMFNHLISCVSVRPVSPTFQRLSTRSSQTWLMLWNGW